MSKLNLKHLRYFWTVASQGSIARAAELLYLTPQTISGQLKELERQVGTRLFVKAGRNLVLSDTGRLVFSYADEMFRLGEELQDVLQGRSPGSTQTLKVGIAMVVPKLLAYRVLEPALRLPERVRLVADCPVNPVLNVRAYNHLLGESGIGFFAARSLAAGYTEEFPRFLDGAPMLMPTEASALRKGLELWFEHQGIRPLVIAEFEDRALMKAFGEAGAGVFTSPLAVADDVLAKYDVELIGRSNDVTERFYAISAERRIKHPAVSTITQAARRRVFG